MKLHSPLPNRKCRKQRLGFLFLAVILASLSPLAAADVDLEKVRAINPDVLPEAEYPYWPAFRETALEDIRVQTWRDKEDIIDGWDWSMPPGVRPSPRSLLGIQRITSLKKEFEPINFQFPVNALGLLWVKWRDIEPEEGKYRFDLVKKRVQQAREAGYEVSLRLLSTARSRGNGKNIEKTGEAPLWLDRYHVATLPGEKHGTQNYDPSDPEFHKRYLKLIDELAKSGLPEMLRGAYVGYASPAFGDEGIGPKPDPDAHRHVRERLDAWARAFKGMEYKVYMGGPSKYGFSKGFGIRKGFVEMYLYSIPDSSIGQYIDEKGYLCVDESAPVIKSLCFNGDENEEYDPAWATAARKYRFGATTNSYPYRFFTSNLRALQMRCTHVFYTQFPIPEMMPFMALELGRTVQDAPDVWCFLRESYMRSAFYKKSDDRNRPSTEEEKRNGIPVKNFERWLYQRDSGGYETSPDIKIQHGIAMWMTQPGRNYDYIARRGKKISFDIDDRWLGNGIKRAAVKITYFDRGNGKLFLDDQSGFGSKRKQLPLQNTGKLRTATFFVDQLSPGKNAHDLVIGSDDEVVISFVRVIKL